MKKYLSLLASFCVAIGFIGCGGSSEDPITPPEPPTPEVIDVVEPTNPASQDGFERVELSWKQDCSADIKKTTIYWNNRQNSQTVNFSAASTSGLQTEGLELSIAEGEYEFELINIDSKGNKSDAVKVAARAYGETFCSELDTREIESIYYEDDLAFITWKQALDGEIRTEYTYTDSETEQVVTAAVGAMNEQIKVLPNEVIKVQTIYQPERCMDELLSPVKEFTVPEPEPVVVPAVQDATSLDGYERVEIIWNHNATVDVAKTVISWNGGEATTEVVYSSNIDMDEYEVRQIIELAEGEYTFELKNIDAKGNESDAVAIEARAYGEAYCSQLPTREIVSIVYEDDHAILEWGEADKAVCRTEYTYTDLLSGEEKSGVVTESNHTLSVAPQSIIKVQSVYQPERCFDELWSPVKEYTVPEPEVVIVPIVQDVALSNGYERVMVTWTHNSTVGIVKTIISWNGGEEHTEYVHSLDDDVEEYQVYETLELAEGEYTLELKNVDAKGNESEPVAIEVRAYGEEYCSKLPTREIISIVYEDDHAVLEWGEADKAATATEYTYTDQQSGEEKVGIVTNHTTITLPVAPLSVIKVQSIYQPAYCMDELRSPMKEYTVPEPEVVDVAEPMDLAAMDGLGRVQISWKQDTSADVSRTVLSWGDESLPYNMELMPDSESGEYSVELTLNEGEYTLRLQNFDSKGNASDVVTIDARSYGEQYCATLPTRELVAITAQGSGASAYYNLSWGTACEGEIRTKYGFTSYQTGAWTEKTAQPTSSKSTFVRAVAGSKIKVQSVFKPENCLDELLSVGMEYDTPAPPAGPELVDVKIMQFNVCVGDWLTRFDGYTWSQRCKQIAALIKEQEPDVICFQELSIAGFYNDIMKAINNTYSSNNGDVYSGVYAERGTPTNEGIGLAYKTSRFDKVNGGMFWLNDHPDSSGLYSAGGLSSNYNRICVWARLRDKSTKGEFVLASTHIDNANNDKHAATDYAVMNGQVQIAINNVQARSKGEDDQLPIIIAGDMNANPDKSPIKRFTNSQNKYTDAYTVAQSVTTQSTSIPRSTMVDVVSGGLQQNYACYDYIFLKRHSKVMSYSINSPKFGGVSLSDHNSVTAVVQLECRVME